MKSKRVSVPRSHAVSHLAKAEQFLTAAEAAEGESLHDAAMLDAIHAAISASDAATIALARVRSTDPDHARAADLLDEVSSGPGAARAASRQLRQLLSRKSTVEYQSRRSNRADATDALKRARRLVDWAREVIAAAKL